MSTPSLRRASAAVARAASSALATTRVSSSPAISIARRAFVTAPRRDDFFDAAVKSSSTTTSFAASLSLSRAYASKGKKASKSKSSQGKRTKGKGMGALPISAKAEHTTKGNKNTYLEALTKLDATEIEENLTPEELACRLLGYEQPSEALVVPRAEGAPPKRTELPRIPPPLSPSLLLPLY